MTDAKKGITLFLLFFSIVLLVSASLRDLWNPDEPRFAQISSEMIQTGNYWIPYLNGEVYTDKPPLFCWISVGVTKLFFNGEVNAFASRFPSVIGSIGTLLLIFWMGQRMFGFLGGSFSLLVLATTYRFWWQASWGQLDMLLCFFIVSALSCFWKSYSSVKTYPFWQRLLIFSLFYFSLAGGFLTKGPIGILIPCGIIFFFLLWERRIGFLLRMWIPLGLLLLAGTIGFWVWGAYLRGGEEYLYEHFIYHNFTRYTDPSGHIRPIYYYFLHFSVDSLPWLLFVPFALVFYRKYGFTVTSERRFLFVWFLLIFIFFSLSDSKRNLYLLPLYPAFALLMGEYFLKVVSNRRLQKIFVVVFSVSFIGFVGALLVVFPIINKYKSARPLCQTIRQMHPDKTIHVGSYQFFKESFLYYLNKESISHRKIESVYDLEVYLKQPYHYVLIQEKELKEVQKLLDVKELQRQRIGSNDFYLIQAESR